MKERLIPVESFSTLKEGDIVRCVGRDIYHTHWAFAVGQDYPVAYCNSPLVGYYGYGPKDSEGCIMPVEHFGHKFARVVYDAEIQEKKASVRYLYVVTDDEGYIEATPDRDEARQIKALFGGKAEGVIITAYTPVKEIR